MFPVRIATRSAPSTDLSPNVDESQPCHSLSTNRRFRRPAVATLAVRSARPVSERLSELSRLPRTLPVDQCVVDADACFAVGHRVLGHAHLGHPRSGSDHTYRLLTGVRLGGAEKGIPNRPATARGPPSSASSARRTPRLYTRPVIRLVQRVPSWLPWLLATIGSVGLLLPWLLSPVNSDERYHYPAAPVRMSDNVFNVLPWTIDDIGWRMEQGRMPRSGCSSST